MTRARRLTLALMLSCAPFAWAQPDNAAQPNAEPAAQPPAVATDPATQPQEQTPAQPAEPALVLRELLVIQTDRYDDTANNPKLVPTTLFSPIKHQDRAKRIGANGAYAYVPMPLGFMTFDGRIDKPIKLRLTLPAASDRFHAHWPDNAVIGGQYLQWADLAAADERARSIPSTQDADWLAPLRTSEDRLWLQSRQGLSKERFLLYDVSFRFKPAIDLALSDNQYRLTTKTPEQAAPPLTVLIRKQDTNWTSDSLAAPWSSTTPAIAAKADGNTTPLDLHKALAPLKDLLAKRGYNDQEITLALDMIASSGLDKSSMSLVYVLPAGMIDKHIRLQIRPMPDNIVRTTIVVVNNVDPDLSSQVNALLDDLGSDQWIKRDRAQRELINLGQAAIKKVQQLKDNKDPEVAFRARQILNAYDWKINDIK